MSEEKSPESQSESPPTGQREVKESFSPALNYALILLAAIVIFIELHYLNHRHNWRWDLTESQKFSLSEDTRDFVSSLDQSIKFILLLPKNNPAHRDVLDLLEEYERLNSKIDIEIVDILRHPEKISTLKKTYKRLKQNTALIVTMGSRKKYLASHQISRQGPGGKSFFTGEKAINSALLNLSKEEKLLVAFSVGHGEPSLTSSLELGLSEATSLLEANNYKVQEISLAQSDIPQECQVLVVAHPQKRLGTREERKILAFLRRGGRLLLLADPESRPGMERVLKRYGIELERGAVFEPNLNRWNNPQHIIVENFLSHEITEALKGYATSHAGVRPLAIKKGSSAKILMKSSSESMKVVPSPTGGTTVREKGAFPLAVGAAKKEKNSSSQEEKKEKKDSPLLSRCVVIGDAHFAFNGVYRGQMILWGIRSDRNQDLFLGAVNWLAQGESKFNLTEKTLRRRQMTLSTENLQKIWWFTCIFLPMVSLFLGFSFWLLRKS